MLMIPDKINDLNFDIKNIENIVFSNNTISWFVLDIGNKITLTKYPLCLKFENNEKKEELQTLIQDHFDKMKLLGQPAHHMQEEACKQLRNSIYDENKIDGEKNMLKPIIICHCYIFLELGLVPQMIITQKDMQ